MSDFENARSSNFYRAKITDIPIMRFDCAIRDRIRYRSRTIRGKYFRNRANEISIISHIDYTVQQENNHLS